jgi:hypothetical protein
MRSKAGTLKRGHFYLARKRTFESGLDGSSLKNVKLTVRASLMVPGAIFNQIGGPSGHFVEHIVRPVPFVNVVRFSG